MRKSVDCTVAILPSGEDAGFGDAVCAGRQHAAATIRRVSDLTTTTEGRFGAGTKKKRRHGNSVLQALIALGGAEY